MPTTIASPINRFIEQHYESLFRFAASLCGRPETALELTQRTFHRALERDVVPPGRTNAKQWLFTILFIEFLTSRRAGEKSRVEGNFS